MSRLNFKKNARLVDYPFFRISTVVRSLISLASGSFDGGIRLARKPVTPPPCVELCFISEDYFSILVI